MTERELRQRVAKNVRAKRKKLGLAVSQASMQAKIHGRHWQKIEAGEVNLTLSTLLKLAEVLMTEPGKLVMG